MGKCECLATLQFRTVAFPTDRQGTIGYCSVLSEAESGCSDPPPRTLG